MVYKDQATKDREMEELKGATHHKFNDFVNVEGTGKFESLPKGKVFERVHRLAAAELKKKGYANIV